MYVTPEQIQAANKANVEAFLAVANAQFSAFEKLAGLYAGAVKTTFEDSISNTRALLGAKDVQELATLQNSFAQPAVEKAIAYSKSVYEVATGATDQQVGEWIRANTTIKDSKAAIRWNNEMIGVRLKRRASWSFASRSIGALWQVLRFVW